jgi:4a-hydroxytetrahydrobiopterin dehydratase
MSEHESSELANRNCVPCKGGIPPLKGEMLQQYQNQLAGDWKVVDEQRLEKTYKFKNFRQALDFTVQVGELAENVNHHPDIFLAWGQVKLQIWTHKIGGLSESDFILAAKADRLFENHEERI